MKSTIIRSIPLFTNLPEDEISYLAKHVRQVDVLAGTVVFHEGDSADSFLVVLSGKLKAIKSMDTIGELILDTAAAGEYVGEMGMLRPGHTRSASVRAETDARFLEMTREDFNALLARQPALFYEMTRTLSDRLDQANNHTIQDLKKINRELQAAYDELKAAQQELIEKEKLEHELNVARQIQESILPEAMPQIPGLVFDAVMIPTRVVGGDLFDFVVIDDLHVGIAVADVADKGVPAAIFMALTRSLLRAEAMRSVSPGTVLRNVNRVLLDMNTADMFVTVTYGALDLRTLLFEYARAGHPAPLIVKDKIRLIEPTNRNGQPLGLFGDLRIDEQQIQLEPRDTILLYSDGVTEAVNEQLEEFGINGLRRSLLAAGDALETPFCRQLVHALDEFRGQAHQNDDITLASIYIS